jgi:hypothetical protein
MARYPSKKLLDYGAITAKPFVVVLGSGYGKLDVVGFNSLGTAERWTNDNRHRFIGAGEFLTIEKRQGRKGNPSMIDSSTKTIKPKLVRQRDGKVHLVVGKQVIDHDVKSVASAKQLLKAMFGSRFVPEDDIPRKRKKATKNPKTRLGAYEARAILAKLDDDFHALSSAQVERLLQEADRVGYRKPKNASGSRGRYFFAYLQRLASKKNPRRRRNISQGFVDSTGFHPIRSAADYDPGRVSERLKARKRKPAKKAKKARKTKKAKKSTARQHSAVRAARKGRKRSSMTRYRASQNPGINFKRGLTLRSHTPHMSNEVYFAGEHIGNIFVTGPLHTAGVGDRWEAVDLQGKSHGKHYTDKWEAAKGLARGMGLFGGAKNPQQWVWPKRRGKKNLERIDANWGILHDVGFGGDKTYKAVRIGADNAAVSSVDTGPTVYKRSEALAFIKSKTAKNPPQWIPYIVVRSREEANAYRAALETRNIPVVLESGTGRQSGSITVLIDKEFESRANMATKGIGFAVASQLRSRKTNPKAKKAASGRKRPIPAAFKAAAARAKAMTPAQRAAWAAKMQAARKRAAAKRKGR